MRRLAVAWICTAAMPAAAADAQSKRATEILAEARAECARIDAGGLKVEDGAVIAADLDGDGLSDDEVVDFAAVFCDYNLSHWHGTGGAPIHFVIDGERSESWWAHYWSTVDFDEMRVILMARHGSYCDRYGAAPCVQAVVATPEGFSTVVLPFSEETLTD